MVAMISQESALAFTLVSLGMALTPGPNMLYLLSRTLAQGRVAGLVSLVGIALGFVIYMVMAVLGLTAALVAVPYAYDAIRLLGAAYLAWMAWNAFSSGGRARFDVVARPPGGPIRLFVIGLLTSLLNPKIALLYVSLLPQFIDPSRGEPLQQGLMLGSLQILSSLSVNTAVILGASAVAGLLGARPRWARVQRWLMGTVFGALALRLAVDTRR
jgi:threonine/homoserine/homoserine lactone efflux protein